ncbi:MAG: flagellar biosynthesis protein FlgM [Gammaproteobacteria bacterium]|nr:MAG: flagellar biosynthesis protein FlgM [Gammaproteobacteria bacterium]
MRWQGRRKSQNVEDRRRLPVGKKSFSIGALILAAIMAFVAKDPGIFLGSLTQQVGQASTSVPQISDSDNNEAAEFSRVILANLEDTWNAIFAQAKLPYNNPVLVLYSGQVRSACGFSTAASGPFYCPADQKIYLDLSFLAELQRMGAPGDFAFAYVIAHEYGHHISNLIGTLPKVNKARRHLSEIEGNKLSVLLELQADCFAGVWANYANKKYRMLEPGDIQEGLQAAASVGDDVIIGNRPDKFTHGSSRQRMQWLQAGMQSGNVGVCDTFAHAGMRF